MSEHENSSLLKARARAPALAEAAPAVEEADWRPADTGGLLGTV